MVKRLAVHRPFIYAEKCKKNLVEIYQGLFQMYGHRAWWPAENAFEMMLGALLTQNTRWTNVEKAIDQLKQENCLSPQQILQLPLLELERCLKPSGYYRIKTQRVRIFCQWYLSQRGFCALDKLATSSLRKALLSVSGIGYETADAILLYAFKRQVFVIDAYTRRILSRLGVVSGKESYEELRLFMESNLPLSVKLYNNYHAVLVEHAKQRCLARPTQCNACSLAEECNFFKETRGEINLKAQNF